MITLNSNWTFTAQPGDLVLGYAGENKVCTLQIQMTGAEYAGWSFFADVKTNGRLDIWAVDAREQDGNLLLSIPVLQSYIPQGGCINAQLRAVAPDGRAKKSECLTLYAKSSVNSALEISILPSEFEVYEGHILTARDDAEAAAGRAGESEQAAAAAVVQCAQILEDVKASDTWREFGTTPCQFNISQYGELKLKSEAASCAYHAYSDTIKDMDTQSRTYSGGITEDKSKGYYEFTLSSTASQWFSVFVQTIFKGLEIGKRYKIYIDTTGLKPGSTTATMMYGQFLMTESTNGSKGDQIMAPTRISSAGLHGYEFTASSADVMLEYYPGNVTAELVAGYQFRFNDLYINYADAGTAHTPIYDHQGTFASEIVLVDVPSPVNFESTPACTVWYSKPVSNVFTINGIQPSEDGNVTLPDPPVSRLAGKTLVCMGDSITGMFAPPTDYPTMIAQLTGMTVHNIGMEGCRMSQHPDQYYDAFCAHKLADSIAFKDYTLQEAAIGHTGSYAADRVAMLKAIDWGRVDYVTIMYGTNDIQGGVPLDNADNPKDITTYLGACRHALEALWGAYPQLKVLLITPIYRWWDDGADSDDKMFGNRHFYDFVDGLASVAKAYKTPALELYYTLGINKLNRLHYFSTTDGTHPNEAGRRLIGSKVAAKLLSEF
ncbi:SGNH/GDSL hydrolase family protein [Anaeromassilibacillus senegalensis]|uniref:SGNH/GDSL hydrolase family protein n=1 Tax=Anaeromassilibacillus senegalensis TaxID=1673717 RepID=UPI000682A04D|nr:SGNH/GDSL hydrolase family protein [Anaeromassilibacillus senegalensis]